MLRIRLKRFGKIHQPFYRIVLAEHSDAVNGKYLVKIGDFNPFTKKINLDKKLAMEWMNKGAKPSNTVARLFKQQGLEHKSIVIKIYKSKSNAEIEKEKKEKEVEKQQEAAKKEAAKVEFEAKKEADKDKKVPTPEQNAASAESRPESVGKEKKVDKKTEKPVEKPIDATKK